jgi:RNA polymerase sigma-70 factor (ECF subfamily)
LREVCGLTTEEIARAFLTSPATVAQRIVRAKSKIKAARIPYQVPARSDLPDRVDAVLHVIYLVFNEGYSASSGDSLTRADLSAKRFAWGDCWWNCSPSRKWSDCWR